MGSSNTPARRLVAAPPSGRPVVEDSPPNKLLLTAGEATALACFSRAKVLLSTHAPARETASKGAVAKIVAVIESIQSASFGVLQACPEPGNSPRRNRLKSICRHRTTIVHASASIEMGGVEVQMSL